jgi:hypothetical protein
MTYEYSAASNAAAMVRSIRAYREAMLAPIRETQAHREQMLDSLRAQRAEMLAPLREFQAQREKMLASIRQDQAHREQMLDSLRAQREEMLAPIRAAEAQREAMLAPLREFQAEREKMLDSIRIDREAMLAAIRGAVEAQRVAFIRAGQVERADFAWTMIGPVSDAVARQADMVAAAAGLGLAVPDEDGLGDDDLALALEDDAWALRVFAEYTAVMVFLMLLGWWLSESVQSSEDLAEANKAEVLGTLSWFVGTAWMVRKAILGGGTAEE